MLLIDQISCPSQPSNPKKSNGQRKSRENRKKTCKSLSYFLLIKNKTRSQKNVRYHIFFKFFLAFPCPEIVRSQEIGHRDFAHIPFVKWPVFDKCLVLVEHVCFCR